ncbi:MAG TPA: TlpA disulfide reductase family protein [Burkholderiales bacterium]|nr:TlpA disulfide reductase family protein [Burkholderiales bacterium]
MPVLAPLLAALLLVCAGGVWAMPEVGEPAPPLRGTLFSGEPFDLAHMRGKVVLVNFYSSYCKFCAYEIGNLESFYQAHRGEGFEVIAVGVDELRDRDRVQRMLGLYNLPGTMADQVTESGFERRYPTPTAFVIDRKGVLRYRQWGAKMPRVLDEIVLPLLREP